MADLRAPIGSAIANPKFVLWDETGKIWDTVSAAFVAYNPVDAARYGIVGSPTDVTGIYRANNPSPGTGGHFEFVAASGSSLAASDLANLANVLYTGDLPPAVDLSAALTTLLLIKAKTDLLGTTSAPVLNSPFGAAGEGIKVYQRDDYNVGDGRAADWTEPDAGWEYDFTGAVVQLEFKKGAVIWPMTIVSDVPPRKVRLEMTAEQTALINNPLLKGNVVLVQADGDRITLFTIDLTSL